MRTYLYIQVVNYKQVDGVMFPGFRHTTVTVESPEGDDWDIEAYRAGNRWSNQHPLRDGDHLINDYVIQVTPTLDVENVG